MWKLSLGELIVTNMIHVATSLLQILKKNLTLSRRGLLCTWTCFCLFERYFFQLWCIDCVHSPPWLGRRWPHLHGTHMITQRPWHWLGKATCLHQIFSTFNALELFSLNTFFLFWYVHQTFNWRHNLYPNLLCVSPTFSSGNDIVSSKGSVLKKDH